MNDLDLLRYCVQPTERPLDRTTWIFGSDIFSCVALEDVKALLDRLLVRLLAPVFIRSSYCGGTFPTILYVAPDCFMHRLYT